MMMMRCMLPWATSPFIRVAISREKSRSASICTRPKLILGAASPTSDISNTEGWSSCHRHTKACRVTFYHMQMDGQNTLLWNTQTWTCRITLYHRYKWTDIIQCCGTYNDGKGENGHMQGESEARHGKVSPWSLGWNGHHHNQQRQIRRQYQLWQGDLSPIEANFLRFHWKKRDTMRSAGMPTLKISSATNCIESMCTTGVELRHR